MASSVSVGSQMMSLDKLSNAVAIFGPLMASKFEVVLRSVPTLAKYLVWLLLLVNLRSWPLAWHFRVFRPVFRIRFQHKLVKLQSLFKSRAGKAQAEDEWLDTITPIGGDPLNYVVKYNTWASIDDGDFNGHLSNSSYAKTMDAARFKAALAMFPMCFRAGGWMALAATHYSFIREIPMLAAYEVRLSLGTWDQKWVYIVAKVVTKPSKKLKKAHRTPEQPSPRANSEATGTLFNASLRTPADEISTTSTPFRTSETPANTDGVTPTGDTAKALKAVTASLTSEPEPDGAILHTVCVSQCCFKIGRITIPPVLILAMNGFSVPALPSADGSTSPYSRTNPPPHWSKAKAVMSKPHGGSTKALANLFKGGWRDLPEEDRWWDIAMGGATEERRKKGLEIVQALGLGMGGVRSL